MIELSLEGQEWHLGNGLRLDTREIFARLASGDIDKSLLCWSEEVADKQSVSSRFRLVGSYGILKVIGEGAFGRVYIAFDTSKNPEGKKDRLVALKAPTENLLLHYAQSAQRPEQREEAILWARLNIGELFSKEAFLTGSLSTCPSVVSVLDHSISFPYIVLEYCNGGSLTQRMSLFYDAETIYKWAYQISFALDIAHSLEPRNLVHRDLKPGNILLHNGNLKISDFGTSQLVAQTQSLQSLQFGYTPAYAAPEAFDGKAYPATDVWSLGVILYQVVSARLPFAGETPFQLMKTIVSDNPVSLHDVPGIGLDDEAYSLIEACLNKSPSARPSARDCAILFGRLSGLTIDQQGKEWEEIAEQKRKLEEEQVALKTEQERIELEHKKQEEIFRKKREQEKETSRRLYAIQREQVKWEIERKKQEHEFKKKQLELEKLHQATQEHKVVLAEKRQVTRRLHAIKEEQENWEIERKKQEHEYKKKQLELERLHQVTQEHQVVLHGEEKNKREQRKKKEKRNYFLRLTLLILVPVFVGLLLWFGSQKNRNYEIKVKEYLGEMKQSFDEIRSSRVKPEQELYFWQDFLQKFERDYGLSEEDNQIRAKVIERQVTLRAQELIRKDKEAQHKAQQVNAMKLRFEQILTEPKSFEKKLVAWKEFLLKHKDYLDQETRSAAKKEIEKLQEKERLAQEEKISTKEEKNVSKEEEILDKEEKAEKKKWENILIQMSEEYEKLEKKDNILRNDWKSYLLKYKTDNPHSKKDNLLRRKAIKYWRALGKVAKIEGFKYLGRRVFKESRAKNYVDEYQQTKTGIEFVLVKGREYSMGSEEYFDEKPMHKVRVQDFLLAKYEVTQGQWRSVMGNNPAGFKKGDWYPVEKVNWEDSQKFCRKLGLRLPSEAEWEYACRGGNKGKFCFGDDNTKFVEYGWCNKNSGNSSHPVGKKKPNLYGLYDMHGNVWEWCEDVYSSYEKTPQDGSPYTGYGMGRIKRGGSWSYNSDWCRSAKRFRFDPEYRYSNLGFRPAKSLKPSKN